MDMFEFEGKRLLAGAGIPTPEGQLITSSSDKPQNGYPVMLKAQVLTGGRGKAGGVKKCRTPKEFEDTFAQMLGMTIRGHRVRGILVEKALEVQREIYIAITLQGVSRPTLIASASGGMDIEQTAAERPEEIIRLELDPVVGIQGYQISYLRKRLNMGAVENFSEMLEKLSALFFKLQALLIEINPMGVVGERVVAMDAKVVLDDQTAYRQQETFARISESHTQMGCPPCRGDGTTITYIPLEGEIALISDGAGTGMLALDMVRQAGGSVASFCELGGTTPAEVMYKALAYSLESEIKPKCVLIVLIGGFNRMDDMAKGITSYFSEHNLDIPVYTRMCGTMEEEGLAMMENAGFFTDKSLKKTVECAVDAARGK